MGPDCSKSAWKLKLPFACYAHAHLCRSSASTQHVIRKPCRDAFSMVIHNPLRPRTRCGRRLRNSKPHDMCRGPWAISPPALPCLSSSITNYEGPGSPLQTCAHNFWDWGSPHVPVRSLLLIVWLFSYTWCYNTPFEIFVATHFLIS